MFFDWLQGKCDCGHYNSVGGSHQNVSLLMDGGDPCHRCATIDADVGHRCVAMNGIRSLDLAETPVDERINFQNPFDRVGDLSNQAPE